MDGHDSPMVRSPRPVPMPPPGPAARPVGPGPRRRGGLRVRPRFWGLVAALVGVVGGTVWFFTRPAPQIVEAPELTPELRQAILGAIAPGWPQTKPTLTSPFGPIPVTEGRVDGVAAADVDGDGAPEWGVAYAWLGPKDSTGARPIQSGFAVLAGGDAPELLYQAPPAGGWNGPAEPHFADATSLSGRVEAVPLGPDGIGFFQHVSAEMATGGRLTRAFARLHTPRLGEWHLAWEGETEHRWRAGSADETGRTAEAKLEDVDGEGHMAIVSEPTWYLRRLGADGRGAHFSAEGLGKLIHRPSSGRYTLDGLLGADGTERQLRAAPPLLAVRAPKAVTVDGRFGDWEGVELQGLTGLRFEDASLLKYKRRDRHGIEDCSADVRLMWDEAALYVRASVVDDTVAPGPAGRDLYQGDHLAVWVDWDLEGDFRQDARSADDWQIGLKPASPTMPAGAHVWVPKSGPQGVQVASRPLVDGFSGGVYGYELEAAIPWASMGGLPPGMRASAAKATPAAKPGAARRYSLGVAGAVGFGLVLTDSDKRPQELVYVSNPGFTWSAPRSFNTLLLVEPR